MGLFQIITSQKLFPFKYYMTKTIFDRILCYGFFRYIYQKEGSEVWGKKTATTEFTSVKSYTTDEEASS